MDKEKGRCGKEHTSRYKRIDENTDRKYIIKKIARIKARDPRVIEMQKIMNKERNIKIKWTKRNRTSEMKTADKLAEKGREEEGVRIAHNSV